MNEIYIIFDGPPSHESGRFVEVEDGNGKGLGPEQTGADWTKREDGLWQLGPFSVERTSDRTVRNSSEDIDYCAECGRNFRGHGERHMFVTPAGLRARQEVPSD